MPTTNSKNAALIVVDMQEDFCTPRGSLAIAEARGLAPAINELLNSPGFDLKIATQDWHPPTHVSFASHHHETKAGESIIVIENPENAEEKHTITLWPDHCIQGTSGAQIIPEIDHTKFDKIIQKGRDSRLESLSGFGPPFRNPPVSMTDLKAVLEQHSIKHVFVVGVAFDGCVKCTAVDAAEFGYKTYIINEATNATARSKERRAQTLKELEDAGVGKIGLESLSVR